MSCSARSIANPGATARASTPSANFQSEVVDFQIRAPLPRLSTTLVGKLESSAATSPPLPSPPAVGALGGEAKVLTSAKPVADRNTNPGIRATSQCSLKAAPVSRKEGRSTTLPDLQGCVLVNLSCACLGASAGTVICQRRWPGGAGTGRMIKS